MRSVCGGCTTSDTEINQKEVFTVYEHGPPKLTLHLLHGNGSYATGPPPKTVASTHCCLQPKHTVHQTFWDTMLMFDLCQASNLLEFLATIFGLHHQAESDSSVNLLSVIRT